MIHNGVTRQKIGVTYLYTARVSGTGLFPLPMLSLDSCFPATVSDADKMRGGEATEQRSIKVVTITSRHIRSPFSLKRWEGHGWKCEPN